jgi:hypothetical protein
MSDLFHFLAADDSNERRVQRVATAVANKRVKDQFGAFFANATQTDLAARLALVEDDVKQLVADVVEEHGGDPIKIEAAIMRSLSGAEHLKEYQFKKKDSEGVGTEEKEESDDSDEPDEDDVNPKEASVKEARRPKMCPYHSEVTDISLGTGDPQGGYNAMSNQAWGDNHCKGGYQGTCNFKPQMVTQQYWDDKKREYEDRAQQRQLEQEQKIVEPLVPSIETEPVMNAEPFGDGEGEGVTDLDSELAEAPSAVGQEIFAAHQAADAPDGVGGAVKREKLPKADESGLGGPSPKIDKGNSGDENGWTLDDIDTQMSGSPHPVEQQDVTQKPDYEKSDFLDQADTKIKQVELDTAGDWEAGFADGGETHEEGPFTFTEDNGTDPVTRTTLPQVLESSYQDIDKNPIREIIESNFGGFLPASLVDSAIDQFDE